MSFYKKVKFPFEVTKGKAKDLFKLRFIRKSELEPCVQHAMRHNVHLMGRQLDLWYKEQSFTIGYLTKEQDKVYQSRRRLRKELRRIKKVEYARRQEEIRNKLENIRRNMLTMKVVRKFKENLRISRNRQKQTSDAVINSVPVDMEEGTLENDKHRDDKTFDESCKNSTNSRRFSKSLTYEAELQSRQDSNLPITAESYSNIQSWRETAANFRGSLSPSSSDGEGEEDERGDTMGNHDDEARPSLGRYPSSHGPRMETIPEESVEEVEVEMEDLKAQKPRLTKRSLHTLNRSHSRKNIFDSPNGVPLLPDITPSTHTQQPAPSTEATDTFDKETQTSFESRKARGSKKKKRHHEEGDHRKNVTVKVPGARSTNKHHGVRPGSAGSNRSELGSDEGHFRPPIDSYDGDIDFSDLENTSSDLDDVFTDTKHHGAKYSSYEFQAPFPGPGKMTGFPQIPAELIAADLGMLQRLYEQNPFSMQFRERSFYLKSPMMDDRPGSAETRGSNERRKERPQLHTSRPELTPIRTLTLEDIKGRRLEDIRKEMNRHCAQINLTETSNMAVFGKTSKDLQEKHVAPPNSPIPIKRTIGVVQQGPHRSFSQLQSVLNAQKRDRELQRRKIHDLISQEPVQQYERTRSGRLLPFGSPRVVHHEIPSMKDRYFRDKLLKAERGIIVGQNIKMKRFMNRLSRDGESTQLPPISGNPPGSASSRATNAPKKSLSHLFKVQSTEAPVIDDEKVVPSVNTTSINHLKNCRYLREYMPMTDKERVTSVTDRETSWKTSQPPYDVNYIASLQLKLASYCSL